VRPMSQRLATARAYVFNRIAEGADEEATLDQIESAAGLASIGQTEFGWMLASCWCGMSPFRGASFPPMTRRTGGEPAGPARDRLGGLGAGAARSGADGVVGRLMMGWWDLTKDERKEYRDHLRQGLRALFAPKDEPRLPRPWKAPETGKRVEEMTPEELIDAVIAKRREDEHHRRSIFKGVARRRRRRSRRAAADDYRAPLSRRGGPDRSSRS
jgi:hypothetical protein